MDASGGRHNEADVIRLALQEGWDDAQAQELLGRQARTRRTPTCGTT